MGEQGIQERAEDTPLWGPSVEDQRGGDQIKFIHKALLTSADISKCCTETQPKTPNRKQCRCISTVARKISLERPEPRKKPREDPGYEGWPVIFWLCRVEIITEHGQDVQMFIDDQIRVK